MHEYQTKPQDDLDHQQQRHQPEHQTSPAHAPRVVASPAQRQARVLQMQRTHGNKFVQRMLQRDPDDDTATADAGGGGGATSDMALPPGPDGGGAGAGGGMPIGDGSVTLNASGGVLSIGAEIINANASVSRFGGIVQGTTVIADHVAAASYTPGAGNVW